VTVAAAKTPPATEQGPELDAALARIAELEAELAAKAATPAVRLVWVVAYPAISVQPKDADGGLLGEQVVLKQGETLPADCEWAVPFLRTIGHVQAVQVAVP